MLNDNIVDFFSDNIDCVICVGVEVDLVMVFVLLVEVLCCVVVFFELLVKYLLLILLEVLLGLLWIVINIFYQYEVWFRYQVSGQIVFIVIIFCLSIDSFYVVCNIVLVGLGVVMVFSWMVVEDIVVGWLIELFLQW